MFALCLFLLAVTVSGQSATSIKGIPTQKCTPSSCPQPEITARSCLDYLKRGFKTNGFYQIFDFNTNTFMTVYCDMTSEAGAAWTLVESFSLKDKVLVQFYKHTFLENSPVNKHSPNWNLYRIGLSQMSYVKSQSTHWRTTCSFPTHGVDYTDYVRAKFTDFDITTFTGNGICKKVEYVNIRGHQCAQCTAKWWQVLNKYGPTIDSSSSGCHHPHKELFSVKIILVITLLSITSSAVPLVQVQQPTGGLEAISNYTIYRTFAI